MPKRLAGLAARYRDEVRSIESEEGQRNDLERGEGGRERHVELGLPGEVPVMSGTDETAAENENHIKIDNPQSGCALHQPKPMEDDRDDDRDEQLEEALDPEVDDPEAPGICDRVVGRSIKKQSRQVEYGDRRSSNQEEIDETAPLRITPSRRHGAPQQPEPEDKTDGTRTRRRPAIEGARPTRQADS